MKVSLTVKQRTLLDLIKDGGGIKCHSSPGCDHLAMQFYLLRKGDHRDLDGRTVRSLETREFIQYDGGATYIISDAGKKALSNANR